MKNLGTTKFTIYGRFPGMNEIISSNRYSRFAGAGQKKKCTHSVISAIREAKLSPVDSLPVKLELTFYEPNNRRDVDNIIGGGMKFIMDGIVKAGILPDDSRKYVTGYSAYVKTDKEKPRIEIEIKCDNI